MRFELHVDCCRIVKLKAVARSITLINTLVNCDIARTRWFVSKNTTSLVWRSRSKESSSSASSVCPK